MKKKFLGVLAVVLSLVLSLFAFVGCAGKDGEDFSLYAAYQEMVEAGEFTGTFAEFVKEYLTTELDWEEYGAYTTAANASLTSVVSIQALCDYQTWGTTVSYASAGSGVIYSVDRTEGDAYIITNSHVVYDSFENQITDGTTTYTRTSALWDLDYYVYLYGLEYEEYAIPATLVGYSNDNDVAVLQIENSDVIKNSLAQAAVIGDSDKVAAGDFNYLIGNTLGEGLSVTTGMISVQSENTMVETYVRASDGSLTTQTYTHRSMRTDAAASMGNSGGGSFNAKGELIGLLFSGMDATDGQNIANVLPINNVIGVAESILRNCNGTTVNTKKAVLGIETYIEEVKQVYDADTNKITTQETVMVNKVNAGSASYGALQAGSQLLSLSLDGNTVEINHSWQVGEFLWRVQEGDVVTVTYLYNGVQTSKTITFNAGHFSAVA